MRPNTLHHFLTLVDNWKHSYPGKQLGSIMFQNEKLLSNVFWNQKSFNTIHKHPAGAAQLPETIMNPDSVWSYWTDPEKQTVVLRNYIKGNYVVQTRDGIIENGFLVDNTKRFKKGCILLV